MAAPAPLLPLDDPRPRRNQPTITCAAAIAAGKDALYLSLLPKELCALVDNMIPCCGWQWTGKPVAVPLPEEVVRSACPDASYAVTDVGHVVVLKKTLKSGAVRVAMVVRDTVRLRGSSIRVRAGYSTSTRNRPTRPSFGP